MKKAISVILSIIMLTSCFAVATGSLAANEKCDCGVTPVIYVKGRTNIYKDPSLGEGSENMAETNFSGGTESIIEAAANILPALLKAYITDEWNEYCDVLYEEIIPIYDQYKLNNDGEIDNKSGISEDWQIENILKSCEVSPEGSVKDRHTEYAKYWAQFTQFQYDMRLDPRVNAADLKKLVDKVIELTGHDKVNIICRCEGNVIVNAYLNMYGHDAVEGVVMYNSIAMGAEIADDLYRNRVTLDPEAMNSFISGFLDTSPILDFVKATVNLATYNGLLEGGLGLIEDIYDKISLNLLPRLIRDIFGTCPGWWGMVSPEAFEEAKAFVLGSDNADGKYDKLIEKIDEYNEMKKNTQQVLKEAQADGVHVYVLAKYGNPMYPVIDDYNVLGDGVVSLHKQTFGGATTSGMTGTLTDEYIQQRIDAGFEQYISADKKVDASTAFLPEYTWYIKNLHHHDYPWSADLFCLDLLNYNGYATAADMAGKTNQHCDATYGQFMLYQETTESIFGLESALVGSLAPLTEENKDVSVGETNSTSMFAVLFRWLTTFFKFIMSLFK